MPLYLPAVRRVHPATAKTILLLKLSALVRPVAALPTRQPILASVAQGTQRGRQSFFELP